MTPTEIRTALVTMPARAVLALTLFGEARGEPPEGRTAVAWVVKNRAAARTLTIQDVCLQKHQFSCWWGRDRNSLELLARAEAVLRGTNAGDTAWLETAAIAHRVLLGSGDDPTGGSDHYMTTALYRSPQCPAWAKGMTVTTAIGRHTFLRSAP